MSEDACDVRGIVFIDNWLHQVGYAPRALATPFRQKVLKVFVYFTKVVQRLVFSKKMFFC
jgi:hypothetical protein